MGSRESSFLPGGQKESDSGGNGCPWETVLDCPLSPYADPELILQMYDRDHIVVRSGILPSF